MSSIFLFHLVARIAVKGRTRIAENMKMPVTSPICDASPPKLDTNSGKVGSSISKAMNSRALASMMKMNDFPHNRAFVLL